MGYCAAYGCTSSSNKGNLLKRFPKDPKRRAIWEAKIRRQGWKSTNSSRLCEDHFDEDQWEKIRVDGKRKLKWDAIPTVFCFSKPVKKRKPPLRREPTCKKESKPESKLKQCAQESNQAEPSCGDSVPPHPGASLCGDSVPPHPGASSDERTDIPLAADIHPTVTSEDQNQHLECISKLQSVTRHYEELLLQKNKELRNTKIKVIGLQKNVATLRQAVHRSQKIKNPTIEQKLKEIFNPDQLQVLSRSSMHCTKWSNKTISTAFALRFACGSNGYETIRKLQLPYPSIRTLQKKIEHLKFNSGILHEVFDFLKQKVECMANTNEKECVIVLDETALTPRIDYDTANNRFVGNVTLPNHDGNATHALVFMLGGVSTRWKQTVAYYLTGSSVNGAVLKEIILEIVACADAIGLKINAVISDMGATNQGMWKAFGIICGRLSRTVNSIQHPNHPEETIEFIADPVHVLKNIRSSLLANTLKLGEATQVQYNLPNRTINSECIGEFIDLQASRDLKVAQKATSELLDEKHFGKVKVSRARHVLSHDVCCGIKFMASTNDDNESVTTAWFIELVNHWFEVMTSRSRAQALTMNDMEAYEKNVVFLQEFIKVFQDLEIIDGRGKSSWKPIQTGVILTTTSILRLQEKFLANKGFEFLLTSRFTQNCLENLFSVLRMKQISPTALQFKNNLKLISAAQYLKCTSQGTSCDDDDADSIFLSGFLDNIAQAKEEHCYSTAVTQ